MTLMLTGLGRAHRHVMHYATPKPSSKLSKLKTAYANYKQRRQAKAYNRQVQRQQTYHQAAQHSSSHVGLIVLLVLLLLVAIGVATFFALRSKKSA